jgi:hypothetical protein
MIRALLFVALLALVQYVRECPSDVAFARLARRSPHRQTTVSTLLCTVLFFLLFFFCSLCSANRDPLTTFTLPPMPTFPLPLTGGGGAGGMGPAAGGGGGGGGRGGDGPAAGGHGGTMPVWTMPPTPAPINPYTACMPVGSSPTALFNPFTDRGDCGTLPLCKMGTQPRFNATSCCATCQTCTAAAMPSVRVCSRPWPCHVTLDFLYAYLVICAVHRERNAVPGHHDHSAAVRGRADLCRQLAVLPDVHSRRA